MRRHLPSLFFGLVCACGDSGTHKLADAPAGADGHGGSDAGGSDAATLPVTVVVQLQSAPAVGARVYFQNADGSVVATTETGPDGTVSVVMAAGGSVTAIEPPAPVPPNTVVQGNVLDTWLGVQPGDRLLVDVAPVGSVPVTTYTMTVSVTPNPAAARLELDTTCGNVDITPIAVGSGGGTAGLHRRAGLLGTPIGITCPSSMTVADLQVVAFDAQGAVIGSIYAPATPLVDGGTVAITAPYADPELDTFPFTGLGSAESGVVLAKSLATSHGALYIASASVNLTDGSGEGAIAYPIASGTEQIVQTFYSANGSVLDGQSGIDWAPASTPVAYTGADLLPHTTSSPELDPTTHAITWAQGSATRPVDAVLASFGLTRTTTLPDAAVTQDFWRWNIVGPGADAGDLVLPRIPTDVFDFNPAPADSPALFNVTTYALTGGYDVLRPRAFANLDPLSLVTVGETGRFWVTTVPDNQPVRRPARSPRATLGRR